MLNTSNPYTDKTIVSKLAHAIACEAPAHNIKIMHVCGTHENAISKAGLRGLLPENVEVIAGPGCPVCVCPDADINLAIEIAVKHKAILATFGDMMRVPSTNGSLQDAKANGADVRAVYSPFDALKIAMGNPEKEVVFFAVGFETTACGVAALIQKGAPENLSILASHRLIPPSMEFLLGVGDLHIDGFLVPGHVTTVMGLKEYKIFPEAYRMPTVTAGFEPVDILLGILKILRQINKGAAQCENAYQRAVEPEGNLKAQKAIADVFDVAPAYWRGIGRIPRSGLALKERYSRYDARCRLNPPVSPFNKGGQKGDFTKGGELDINPGCSCHLIMIGKIKPTECPMFGKGCLPEKPYGPCMVSMDGTCRIWHRYGHAAKNT
ncbi:MAG: hydrogenase formation protein HypD [Deltaproteobacteria bacterium]|nr:hydrogenase formation protein HypD [Deltaproteobacteria bacterium]